MRESPACSKVSEEGGAGGAPGTRAGIPLQPMEDLIQQFDTT